MENADKQDEAWLAYRERIKELFNKANARVNESTNNNHALSLAGFGAPFFQQLLLRKVPLSELTKFVAYHILIGSSRLKREGAPLFDLPGNLSVEKFLEETIEGRGALSPDFQKMAKTMSFPLCRDNGTCSAYGYHKLFLQTGKVLPPLAREPEKPERTGFGSNDLVMQIHFWGVTKFNSPT